MELSELENRIKKIEERNKIVEMDKAWETSIARKVIIAVFTYAVIGLFMGSISIAKPWINAIVPTLGFLLSTLSLPLFKKIWVRRNRK